MQTTECGKAALHLVLIAVGRKQIEKLKFVLSVTANVDVLLIALKTHQGHGVAVLSTRNGETQFSNVTDINV